MFDASKLAGAAKNSPYNFGVGDTNTCAAALRELADLIEEGLVLVQSAKLVQVVKPDDFLMRTLTVEYVEKIDVPDKRQASLDLEAATPKLTPTVEANSGSEIKRPVGEQKKITVNGNLFYIYYDTISYEEICQCINYPVGAVTAIRCTERDGMIRALSPSLMHPVVDGQAYRVFTTPGA